MLSRCQRILVLALHDERPVERLRELVAKASDSLDDEERAALLGVDPDGLRMTSLLVRKLRFERLVSGDPELRAACERDPRGVTESFVRYARAVPPTSSFPAEEAAAFRRFRAGE